MADLIDNPYDQLLATFELKSAEAWTDAAEKLLKGKPFGKILNTQTYDGFTHGPIFRQADLAEDVTGGLPGVQPFTRGTTATGYTTHPWLIAQELIHPDPDILNKLLTDAIAAGQTAVYIVPDRASERSTFADKSEWGKCGTHIRSYADFAAILRNIDIGQIPLFIKALNNASLFAGYLQAYCDKSGLDPAKVKGAIEFDPIGHAIRTGQFASTSDNMMDEAGALVQWSQTVVPGVKTIGIHGGLFEKAGAATVQQYAYALAMATDYVAALGERGFDINGVLQQVRFSLSLSPNIFIEIAALRAIKKLWATIAAEFGGNEASQKIDIHARTGSFYKTIEDPHTNILRTATEGFAAVLGGINSLHIGPFDHLFAPANAFSSRIARNQHIILKEEANLEKLIDPAGGAWAIEKLTEEMTGLIWDIFKEIEAFGGFIKYLEAGKPQAAIAATREKRIQHLLTRKDKLIGSNIYPNHLPPYTPATPFDHQAFVEKASSQSYDLQADLKAIPNRQTGGSEIDPLPMMRAAEVFENIRTKVRQLAQPPVVTLLNWGNLANHKARADFSREFFEVGGFKIANTTGFENVADMVTAIKGSTSNTFVICGKDGDYESIVPELIPAAKAAKPGATFVLAGYPKDKVEAYKTAGIDIFIHLKANLIGVFDQVLATTGEATNA
jgi:methylmalonyl-CoA mutase